MIGIFDSGIGGLTALREIRRLTPGEEIIYFGDTGRVPYGTKSAETITKFALQDAAFMVSKKVDAILVACGTVSTTALGTLRSRFSMTVTGVLEPAAEAAVKSTKNGKIAVIGTSATVNSGAFPKKIAELCPGAEVISRPCPLFVPLVENGFVGRDCEITRLACEHYLSEIRDSGADTLILGCTHFPIISDAISDVLPNVALINTGAEAAKKLVSEIGAKQGRAPVHYFVSDAPEDFCSSASRFLGEPIECRDVEKIDIELY